MRSVHFTWEFPPRVGGGLGTSASELTRFLVRLGHEVTVMTMNQGNQYPTTDNWKGVEVHRPMLADMSEMFPVFVDHEVRGWGDNIKFFSDVMAYNTLATSKFVNNIFPKKNKEYDLIHAHNWMGILAGVSTKRSTELPLIFQVHSTEKGRSSGMGSRTVEEMEFLGARKADMVVTVSNAMKKEIITLGMAKPETVHVCYNGVDTKKFDPAKVDPELVKRLRTYYSLDEQHKTILFVGRLTKNKGVRNLVAAMPEVFENHPWIKLIILGEGEQLEDLRRDIQERGMNKRIKIRNEFTSEPERLAHYALADLCVFPSIYEPFGIACLEAMSMGKPVVVGASGTNGLKEQVIPDGPGKNGIHVDGTSPKDIAWGINESLSSDDELRRMGANGRKRAQENFEWEELAQEMLNIYGACCGHNGKNGRNGHHTNGR